MKQDFFGRRASIQFIHKNPNSTTIQFKFTTEAEAQDGEKALKGHEHIGDGKLGNVERFISKKGNHIVRFFASNGIVDGVEDEGYASEGNSQPSL